MTPNIWHSGKGKLQRLTKKKQSEVARDCIGAKKINRQNTEAGF